MRFCPFCANEAPGPGAECPHCGKRLPDSNSNENASPKTRIELASPAAHPGKASPLASSPDSKRTVIGHRITGPTQPSTIRLTEQDPNDGSHTNTIPKNVGAASMHRASDKTQFGFAQSESTRNTANAPNQITSHPPASASPAQFATGVPQEPLDPMPGPPDGLWNCLPYFFRVSVGRIKRRSAIRKLERENQRQQGELDAVFVYLGRAALEIRDTLHGFDAELATVDTLNAARADLHSERQTISDKLEAIKTDYVSTETVCLARLDEERAVAADMQGQVSEQHTRMSELRNQVNEIERELRNAIKRRDAKQQLLPKIDDTDQREVAEREVGEIQNQIEELDGQKQALAMEVEAIQLPLDELNIRLAQARTAMASAQTELDGAKRKRDELSRGLSNEQRKLDHTATLTEQKAKDGLLALGRALEKKRPEEPKLIELYESITLHRNKLDTRAQHALRIEADSSAFDKRSYRNGAILSGAIVSAIVLLFIVLAFAAN